MALKKKVKRIVLFELVRFVAQFFYFAGLTSLIPLLPLLLSPWKLLHAYVAFSVACGFVLLSFFLVYLFTESKRVALRSLGLMTLIPGFIAVVFGFLGPRRVSWLYANIEVPLVDPLIEQWLNSSVPKAWLLAGIYIVVGVILVWVSEKVKR